MFNSTKTSDSSRVFKSSILNSNDETVKETSKFLPPKITSTPLSSIFATPPKSRVLSPRRYSLSEMATPPRINRREFVRSNSQYPPGPLLASTKYNINVSTFEDVKSPGLTSRIVQYNEEAEREKEQRHPATHQVKYGSLGLFPIVHLFKKKLPLLEQKPRHVTVRVASPDYMKFTPDHNRRLLEGIVKSSGNSQGSPSNSNTSENSTSPRSVLDALKEISRKRIHANEEIELHEDTGKRLRTDNDDCIDSNKRLRDESPLLETASPTRPASKKICMYDEYAASCSSMDFLNKSNLVVPKRKSISISTITENIKESKQVKLINAETQTVSEKELNKSAVEEDKEQNNQNDKSEKVETVLKVFDDAPLERIRKNRLAALMGTLVGKNPILEPKPDYSSLLQEGTDNSKKEETIDKNKGELTDKTTKPLISILTPSNKSPIKSAKHVHFNIPESSSDNSSHNFISATISVPTTCTKVIATDNSKDTKEKTLEYSIPAASTVNTGSAPTFPLLTSSVPSSISNNINLSSITSKPFSVTTSSSPPKIGGFKFDLAKSESSVSTIASLAATTTTTTTAKEVGFSFGPSTTATTLLGSTTSVTTFGSPIVSSVASPQNKPSENLFNKVSSFTNQNNQSVDATGKSNFLFGSSASNNLISEETKTSTTPASTVGLFEGLSSPNNQFKTVTTSAKTSFSTLTSISNKGLITSPSLTSNFASPSSSVLPAFGTGVTSTNVTLNSVAGNTFGNINSTHPGNTGVFENNTTSGSTFVASTGPVITGFGTTTSIESNKFGISTTSATKGFGTSTTSGFNVSTTPNFGTFVSSANNVFGTPTTSATEGFGSTVSSTATSLKTSSPFTAPTSTVNSGFGVSTSVGGFGISTFGTPTTSSSFNPTTSLFGFGSTNTTSTSIGFRAPTTTANAGFGTTASGFGTTTGSGFGTTTTSGFSTTTSSGFGPTSVRGFGTTVSGFGTTTPSGFGTTTASGFGTTTASDFGTTASGFGTTTASGFGTTTAPGFGTTTAPGFGTTTASGFGTTTAGFGTNAGSLFGNSSIPSFGGTSNTTSFGSTSSGSSFADAPFGRPTSTSTVFGANTTNATPSFVNENKNKIFGGNTSTFGAPSTSASTIFGTTQTPFGAGINNTTAATPATPFTFTAKTAANSFGTTNTTTASFGSSFGQSVGGFATQQPSTFGAPNKAIFVNNTAPAFGGTSAPGFDGNQQQTFGTTGSVFNKPQSPPQNAFGSTQFSFNQQQSQQNNANSFGTTSTQPAVFAFGSSAPEKSAAFNFSAAASGETPKKFDFTGGSTAPLTFAASFGGTPAISSFGAPAPVTGGGFSIGAGPPTTPRTRTVIKGKRRT